MVVPNCKERGTREGTRGHAAFANAWDGWVVVMINPGGSEGYGRDRATCNWGANPCMPWLVYVI